MDAERGAWRDSGVISISRPLTSDSKHGSSMASNSSSAQQRLRIIAGHLQKRVEDESASVATQECKAEAPRSEPSSATPVPRRRYVTLRVSLCAEISGSSHRLRNKHCVALKTAVAFRSKAAAGDALYQYVRSRAGSEQSVHSSRRWVRWLAMSVHRWIHSDLLVYSIHRVLCFICTSSASKPVLKKALVCCWSLQCTL